MIILSFFFYEKIKSQKAQKAQKAPKPKINPFRVVRVKNFLCCFLFAYLCFACECFCACEIFL